MPKGRVAVTTIDPTGQKRVTHRFVNPLSRPARARDECALEIACKVVGYRVINDEKVCANCNKTLPAYARGREIT